MMIKNRFYFIVLFALAFYLATPNNSAYAHCKPCGCEQVCQSSAAPDCSSDCAKASTYETGTSDKPKTTLGHITDEFNKHRDWIVQIFFLDEKPDDPPGLLAAMKAMTTQLTTIGIQQVEIIGSFFDAKHQLETQRLIQQLTARAHKDYHPSQELCEIGTFTRSLFTSDRNSDLAAIAFSKRSVKRQLLSEDTVGADGIESDQNSRLVQFIKKYCDKRDNSGGLDLLCTKSENKNKLFNKDVNYTYTIDSALTLDLDFTDEGLARPEEEKEDEFAVFALTSNLFAHQIFPALTDTKFVDSNGDPDYEGAAKTYMDARALIAKRSVASNSIGAITAMKAKGDTESQPFIYALIEELGNGKDSKITIDEIKEWIGENPSYYAQMEILTKKVYQDPNFYANLYDKPANVLRQDVAIQAATLMQKRDLYRSYLRSEMLLATMLETALRDEQERVVNEIPQATEGRTGRTNVVAGGA